MKIESLQPKDCDLIVKWNENKDAEFLYQWAGPTYTYPITSEQVVNGLDITDVYIYKIINKEEIIGVAEIGILEEEYKSAKICRVLIRDEDRNKGYGENAVKILSDIIFTEMELEKIYLGVFKFNKAGIRCYEKAGFTFLEEQKNDKDSKRDLYVMECSKN